MLLSTLNTFTFVYIQCTYSYIACNKEKTQFKLNKTIYTYAKLYAFKTQHYVSQSIRKLNCLLNMHIVITLFIDDCQCTHKPETQIS